MTRINTIAPSLLLDQHLVAEWRELPRIPNELIKYPNRLKLEEIPHTYTMGAGHVKFFRDKLLWLSERHTMLCNEMDSRGINRDPNVCVDLSSLPSVTAMFAANDWSPTCQDHLVNFDRICERWQLRKRKYTYNGGIVDCDHTFTTYREKALAWIQQWPIIKV